MLHQFDHRWATYDGGDESRDVKLEEKRNPAFVVQPRYWVCEEIVASAIPQYPSHLASALRSGDRDLPKTDIWKLEWRLRTTVSLSGGTPPI